jgi:hypothetical protein
MGRRDFSLVISKTRYSNLEHLLYPPLSRGLVSGATPGMEPGPPTPVCVSVSSRGLVSGATDKGGIAELLTGKVSVSSRGLVSGATRLTTACTGVTMLFQYPLADWSLVQLIC